MNLNAEGIFFLPVFIATAVFLPIHFLHILYFTQQVIFFSPSITTRDTLKIYIIFRIAIGILYHIVQEGKQNVRKEFHMESHTVEKDVLC